MRRKGTDENGGDGGVRDLSAEQLDLRKLYHRFRLFARLWTGLPANVEFERKKEEQRLKFASRRKHAITCYSGGFKEQSRDTPSFVLNTNELSL
jgi:hypothetical protein